MGNCKLRKNRASRVSTSKSRLTPDRVSLVRSFSKQNFLAEVTNPYSLPDHTPSFKEYTGSKNNRFLSLAQACKNRIQPPSKVRRGRSTISVHNGTNLARSRFSTSSTHRPVSPRNNWSRFLHKRKFHRQPFACSRWSLNARRRGSSNFRQLLKPCWPSWNVIIQPSKAKVGARLEATMVGVKATLKLIQF